MLKSIVGFLQTDKKFTLLFIVVAGIYAAFFMWGNRPAEKRTPSAAVQKFERVQKQWENNIKNTKALEEYLKKKPALNFMVQLFSLLTVVAIGIGIVLNFMLLLKPALRSRFSRDGPPDFTEWRLGMLFKVVVLILGANIVLAVILGLVRRFFGVHFSMNVYALFHTTVIDALCLIFILSVIRPFGGSRQSIGLDFSGLNLFREIGIGIGGYLAILPVFLTLIVGLILFAKFIHYEPPPHPLVELFLEEEKRAPWVIVYSLFLASIAGPVFEEIFFRGFCYNLFKNKWGSRWAMILSAAFFSVIHQSEFAFLPIFLLGLALAYLYEKRGSLVASITLHVVHNSIFIGYFFLAKHLVLAGSGG